MPDKPRDETVKLSTTTDEAKKYQAIKNRLFLFHLIFSFFILVVLVSSGASRSLKIWLLNLRDDFFSIIALYFVCFNAIVFFLSFPFDFYEGFILEHRFGLSKQTFRNWFKDLFKKAVIAFVVSLVVVEAVYLFLSQFPQSWWFWAALFWFLVSVILTKISPQVILPLFFKSRPLESGQLRDRILEFLKRHKIRTREVYVLDFSKKTVRANAMVAGLGATKKIFLSDTLVSEFSGDEIMAVLAHEVGHYLSRDTLKLVLVSFFSALLSFLGAALVLERFIFKFGFSAISDIAGLPLLLAVLMLAGLLLLPLQNGFSRFLERRADDFALRQTQDPKSFISMMARLGKKNFSEFSPSKLVEIFMYDHPPISKRIKLAKMYSGDRVDKNEPGVK